MMSMVAWGSWRPGAVQLDRILISDMCDIFCSLMVHFTPHKNSVHVTPPPPPPSHIGPYVTCCVAGVGLTGHHLQDLGLEVFQRSPERYINQGYYQAIFKHLYVSSYSYYRYTAVETSLSKSSAATVCSLGLIPNSRQNFRILASEDPLCDPMAFKWSEISAYVFPSFSFWTMSSEKDSSDMVDWCVCS